MLNLVSPKKIMKNTVIIKYRMRRGHYVNLCDIGCRFIFKAIYDIFLAELAIY